MIEVKKLPDANLRVEKMEYVEFESWHKTVWKRFRRHKLALLGLIILTITFLSAVFAPYLVSYPPQQINLHLVPDGQPLSPSLSHPFGTDSLGRDYFSRALYGGRISLAVGIVSVSISVIIGVLFGAVAGFYGGLIDTIICRFIDILLCIPTFFLILTVNAYLGPSIFNIMIVIGAFGWMGVARLVRSQFLSLKEQDFVQAAKALGSTDLVVIFRHLLPNAMAPVIVAATMGVATAIIIESSLSFLGLGVQEPTSSWGSMLRVSQIYLRTAPWLAIFPGVMISMTVLALNFIGDGLRDALDPKLRN